MSDQFIKYDSDVSQYMVYLKNQTDHRQNVRDERSLENNPFAVEQKELLTKLEAIQPKIT